MPDWWPDWWFEATLPTAVFIVFFLLWVALPPRPGEEDLAARIRARLWRR